MSEDKIPQVVVVPEVQAQLDADPELAKAVAQMSALFRQGMQAVKDGRYKSFDEAMTALGFEVEIVRDENGDPITADDADDADA